MRIGIICGEYPPCNNGGIGTYTKELAEGLVIKGHAVVVFGVYYPNYLEIVNRIDENINGVEIVRLPFKFYLRISFLNEIINRFMFWIFTQQLIKKKSIELIEVYDSTGILPFPIRIPKITRLHGTVTFFGKELKRPFSKSSYLFEKLQIKTSTDIVGVSKYVLNKTREYFGVKKQGTVIYNSVVIPEPKKTKVTKDIANSYLLFYGSLLPKKGIEQLVQSMNLVLESNPNTNLYIIGKSNRMIGEKKYSQFLLEMVEPQYQNRINFMGHMNKQDLTPIVENSFCCIFPSHSECFALAPMEAMALGIPVIYSSLHSGPELITSGIDGYLVNPFDIKEIAEKICQLINNPTFAKIMGELGRKKILENFDYNGWLEQNETYFEKIINKKI
jgi:glycosyltransferase involved in cell wall biosynthesis